MHNATATFHVVCRRRCRPQADNEYRHGIARCIVSSALAGLRPVGPAMSALGHERTLRLVSPMSALILNADISRAHWDVCLVPKRTLSNVAVTSALASTRTSIGALTDAIWSPARAAFHVAGRQDGNSVSAL